MRLKEIKIRRKLQTNRFGVMKKVYDFEHKPNYIIKTWPETGDSLVQEEYKVFEKYPELFAEINKINWDKRWMIQEKLDTTQVEHELRELSIYLDLDYAYQVTKFLFSICMNSTQKKHILQKVYYENPEGLDLLIKWLDFFNKVARIKVAHLEADVNPQNMGYDKHGNLKLLDI
jgi:hypothetical protein